MDQDFAHMVAASKVLMLKPENGATLPKTKVVKGVTTEVTITTVKEKAQRRLEGNAATKKTQRNLLIQQYENFTAPSLEMLDQTFDRIQKLVSQLELLNEKLSQEDDLEQIHPDDMEEMDLRWQMAMLTMRARSLDEFVNKPVVENYKAKSSEEEPKVVRKHDDAPIIKEWVLDDEKKDVSQPKI
nr:hypothetical protein [Tanacetum cinerariifolium]